MRRFWLLGISVFCLQLFIPCFGQKKIKWGINAGINNAILSGNISNLPYAYSSESASGQITSLDFSRQIGFAGGVHAEIPIGKQSFFQPELQYSQMGSKCVMNMEITQMGEENNFLVPINGKIRLGYLTLPLLYKYKLEERDGGWAFYGGMQPAYMVTNSISLEGNTIGRNLNLNNKKWDVQGVAGVEFFLPKGWGATVRYQLGLLTREEGIGPLTSQKIRNSALSVMLSYVL